MLELTNDSHAVSLKELRTFPGVRFTETLDALDASGLITLSDGVIAMDGRQRIMLAEKMIHGGIDAKQVSRLLGWQEFEVFANDVLSENGFSTRKHLVFKSSKGRREIDILAWNDTFVLAVDCKHWLRGLSAGRIKEAAQAQVDRVAALAEKPELLHKLRVSNVDERTIIPVILSLCDPLEGLVNGVPIVSVSKLLSFIYGVSPIDAKLRRIPIESSSQCRLT